jgi:methionine synthase II (cobalamin-independent)
LTTRFVLSLTGIHARAEGTIQATQDWERGRVSTSFLKDAFRKDRDALVELQERLGADYISDGQLTTAWQDLLTPVTSGFSGLKKGPMFRWYNTNTFYYAPVIQSELSSDGRSFSRTIERRFVKGRMRLTVPDPLTFSELAIDKHYGSDGGAGGRERVLFAYAEALNSELKTLEKDGVLYVQFSCPALVARFWERPISNDRLASLGEAIRIAKRGTSIVTGFHTLFGDASPYFPALFDAIPTDDIGLDFTQTDPEGLPATSKGIIAGVADARTTYLETIEELSERVEIILRNTGTKRVTLAPSADLRYIPRVSADEKLERLASLRTRFEGGRA